MNYVERVQTEELKCNSCEKDILSDSLSGILMVAGE